MSDTSATRSWPLRAARGLAVAVALVAAFLVGSAIRLTQGPIVLPQWMVEVVEDRLTRTLAGPDVQIARLAVAYDTVAERVTLALADGVLTDGGQEVLRLPRASVTIDGPSLLQGQLLPRNVNVQGLALDLMRDGEGRFSLALGTGQGGDLPADWVDGLAALDGALAIPMVAALERLEIAGITLRLRDEITGLAQDIKDGGLDLRRTDAGTEVTLAFAVPTGAGRLAQVSANLSRSQTGDGARASLAMDDLPLGYLADRFPNIPALTLVRGHVSAAATMVVSEDGTPGPAKGRVEVREPVMVSRPGQFNLDRAALAVAWVPGSDRVALSEITASSDEVLVAAHGQILLEDGLTGPIQSQLIFDDILFDPEAVFERRIAFDAGLFEARLTQQPLALRIGQAMLTGPSGTARLQGTIDFLPEGPAGGVRLSVPEIAVGDLRALWPNDLQPESRRWFANNMLNGVARNVEAAVRLRPGDPPDVLGSFDFEAGSLRFMRFMPAAEGARGAAQLEGTRLSLRIDGAEVPAIGPGESLTAETDRLRVGPSTFVIADATQRPPVGELTLRASGDIGGTLTLLNNRPLELLDRIEKDRRFATGRADAVLTVRLPLRPRNAPAEIDWTVDATLASVRSDQIVEGRVIEAPTLRLKGDPDSIEIAGDMTLDSVPFSGSWRQALPPRSTAPIDPDGPRPPREPLPDPGRIAGIATLTPEGLDRLGISLGALQISGRTQAEIDIDLPAGAPPRLRARSTLEGMAVSLPAISWRKPARRSASLDMDVVLGPTPDIPSLTFDAPGLSVTGQITLTEAGDLRRARLNRVDTGWFRGPVVFTGRGRDVPPAIAIQGGTADLRQALLIGEDSGGDGDSAPLDVALSRLVVTDGIALTDLRATLRGGGGQFRGSINGAQPIEGVLAPQSGGSAVQIRSSDAGAVLRAADFFKDARGGDLSLTLRPTDQDGQYSGALRMANLRVRNAPALASLLQALSVVGILEQLGGDGLFFQTVESDFTLRPNDIVVRRASAVGPSMSITADGTFDSTRKALDMQGVISPIYLVNGLFGALFARRDEGLFGFTYRLQGAVDNPQVSVNPLSILTPGVFRDIFRRPPPEG